MSVGQRLWTVAVCAHLALAVCGAAGRFPIADTLPKALLAQYGYATGTDSDFGFFAPAVASQSRAIFLVRDAAGHEREDTLFRDLTSAYGMRAASVLDSFARLPERMQRGVTASWAGVMFGRHPDATEVVVRVEMQSLPTMEQWRDGERPSWESIYEGTFLRTAGVDGTAEH